MFVGTCSVERTGGEQPVLAAHNPDTSYGWMTQDLHQDGIAGNAADADAVRFVQTYSSGAENSDLRLILTVLLWSSVVLEGTRQGSDGSCSTTTVAASCGSVHGGRCAIAHRSREVTVDNLLKTAKCDLINLH